MSLVDLGLAVDAALQQGLTGRVDAAKLLATVYSEDKRSMDLVA